MEYDITIIGAGPAGYLAAIRLAQLGAKVLVIEKEVIGGECLNYACIPSKTLIHYASMYSQYVSLGKTGLFNSIPEINLDALQDIKKKVVKTLTSGVNYLFKVNGVDFLKAVVEKIEEGRIYISQPFFKGWIKSSNIVIATGSRPRKLLPVSFDHEKILTSREILDIRSKPDSLIVIGGGAIGVEAGSLYNMLRTKVTIIELLDRIVPFMDLDISRRLRRELERRNITIFTAAKVVSSKILDNGVEVSFERYRDINKVFGEKVLVSVGRVPNTGNLGLRKLGVNMDKNGFIKVGERQETNIKGIYAIGDVAGPPLLAHKAYWEGLNLAESLYGEGPLTRPSYIPYVVFSKPEALSIGLTEKEARKSLNGFLVGRFPFTALGRAISEFSTSGVIKVIADKQNMRIVGIHIIGEHASAYSAAASLIVENGIKIDEVDKTMFPHPTYSEGLWEAIRNLLKKSLHIKN